MKENKDHQLKCRMTSSQKEKILAYCDKHNITISEFIRFACEKIFNTEKE